VAKNREHARKGEFRPRLIERRSHHGPMKRGCMGDVKHLAIDRGRSLSFANQFPRRFTAFNSEPFMPFTDFVGVWLVGHFGSSTRESLEAVARGLPIVRRASVFYTFKV
jgi:hypothetical protein